MALTQVPIELSSTPGIVDNSNATAITIDSSENLLVGKTATAVSSEGIEVRNNGLLVATRNSNKAAILNRRSSDGDIIEFNKDSAAVGSIGTLSGFPYMYGGTGFLLSSTALRPADSDGTNSDADTDLGSSSSRFKDLYLSGTVTATDLTLSDSTNPTLTITDTTNTTSLFLEAANLSTTVGTLTNHPLKFDTNNTERMRVDELGNLYIGKSVTTYNTEGAFFEKGAALELTTSGGRVLRLNRTSTDGSILEFNKGSGSVVGSILSSGGDGIIVQGVAAGSGLLFHNSDALLPAQNGNAVDATIDLGRSTPSAFRFKDLYLSGNASMGSLSPGVVTISSGSYFIGNSANGYRFNNAANTSNLMILKDSGDVLFNTSSVADLTNNAFTFDQGTGRVTICSTGVTEPLIVNRHAGNGTLMEIRRSNSVVGTISVTASATAYNTSSDQRLKENIADADDAGSKVDAIQVRKFDWKADGSHQDYGMIAQELQAVAPEAVSAPEDPDEMMGVDYSKLVPMLVKEIQSLRNRVAQLEN